MWESNEQQTNKVQSSTYWVEFQAGLWSSNFIAHFVQTFKIDWKIIMIYLYLSIVFFLCWFFV